MNKTVVMLMGKSGCGKSTLEKGLIDDPSGLFKKVVSTTTRPIRENELDGVDYKFVTTKQFNDMYHEGEFIQYTHFADNQYGSTVSEYTTEHPFVTLVVIPSSGATFASLLKERFENIKIRIIYFDISDNRLRENMKRRGDTDDMITERLAKDDLDQQFKQHGLIADYVVTDELLDDKTTDRVLSWLKEQ